MEVHFIAIKETLIQKQPKRAVVHNPPPTDEESITFMTYLILLTVLLTGMTIKSLRSSQNLLNQINLLSSYQNLN
jgi:Ni,Fe-hydrogenase I cytochrome b subunit